MPTANELLRDATISHQVDLAQYSAHVVRRMIGVLNRSDADLMAALNSALDRLDVETFSVERLELVLQSVRAVNVAAYQALERELSAELRLFAEVEAQAQADLLADAVPEPIAPALNFVRVEPAQVYAAAMARPFQGRLLREWASSMEAARMQRVRDAVSIGFTTGKTVDQIAREIRGTRAAKYADGFLQIDRRGAQAVVRTAVQHLAATVQQRTFAENADVVKAVVWSATLDNRTSAICRVRDRKQYRNTERHEPIGHSIPWLAGPGRSHWNAVVGGTLVTTKRGLIPIERVLVGDFVLTHAGRFRLVLDVRSKKNESGVVRVVHTESGRVLRATDDHPVATSSGWRFVGALEVGDNLFGDPHCLHEVRRVGRQVGAEPEDGPSVADSSHVALQRTIQLVAANINLKRDHQFGAREVENHVIDAVLSDPSWVEDQCFAHHLLATADALKKLGGNGLGDLLSNRLRDLGVAHAVRDSLVMPGCEVGGYGPLDNAGHSARVVLRHSSRVHCHRAVCLLCLPPRPMLFSCGSDAPAGGEVEARLLGFGPDWDGMPLGVGGEASVCESVRALDLSERYSISDVAVDDQGLEHGVRFSHDRVCALELQKYDDSVYDLEVEGDASYFASGIAVSNCRSAQTPVLKSLAEITGLDIRADWPEGTRASMDGQVPKATTYGEWLQRQTAARQDEVVGPTRGRLMREGKLPFDALYTNRGEYLTLDELRARHPGAFRRAGV